MWRARTKLKPQDLGIDPTIDVQKALSLGCHRLMPPKVFDEINESVRAAVRAIDYCSLNFAMIPGTRYVPDTNLPKLLEQLKEYKRRFYFSVDNFISSYEEMKSQMLPIIESALKEAAKDPESAGLAYSRILSEYPDAEEVKRKFSLFWNIYTIQGAKNKEALNTLFDESSEVQSIVRSMVEQLRGEVQGKLSGIIELINKGGKLKSTSIESALGMIERIETLNLFGDSVLDDQIKRMKDFLNGIDPKSKIPNKALAIGFEEIQKNLSESLEEAVKKAEENLVSMGRRKLTIDKE
jgi:hypothetical protein